ncbi:MAG: gamma-glutamylcyclotransferase [bacterium]
MIDREFLRSGGLSRALGEAAREGQLRLTTPAERLRVRKALLTEAARHGPQLWVFAYGSLMWNPAFHHAEAQAATVHGYHRRFCLQVVIGRGSRRNPGLLLGLEPGGSCRGVAFRIAPRKAAEELDIILAREMVAEGYKPVWVRAHCAPHRRRPRRVRPLRGLPRGHRRAPRGARHSRPRAGRDP